MQWDEWTPEQGMEWKGMDSQMVKWKGMEWKWNGMEWNGRGGGEWNGMEWNGSCLTRQTRMNRTRKTSQLARQAKTLMASTALKKTIPGETTWPS